MYTRKPVLDLLVTVSEAWSASTFALVVNPMPLGCGAFGGKVLLPCKCPNSLDVQSFLRYLDSSMTGPLGSNTS